MTEHNPGHDDTCVCWQQRWCGCYLFDQDCPYYQPIKEDIMPEPIIHLNENALTGDQGYTVELGDQRYTQAQWETFLAYSQHTSTGHKAQRQVAEFHTGMGQPVGTSPRALPAHRIPVRIELIREEFIDELIPALGARLTDDGEIVLVNEGWQNVVEVADAAIDILYVVYGLLVEMGIDAEPLFDEVQASNMSKFGADGKPIIAGPNDPDGIFEGRVKKGPNYFRPNLERALREQGWQPES